MTATRLPFRRARHEDWRWWLFCQRLFEAMHSDMEDLKERERNRLYGSQAPFCLNRNNMGLWIRAREEGDVAMCWPIRIELDERNASTKQELFMRSGVGNFHRERSRRFLLCDSAPGLTSPMIIMSPSNRGFVPDRSVLFMVWVREVIGRLMPRDTDPWQATMVSTDLWTHIYMGNPSPNSD